MSFWKRKIKPLLKSLQATAGYEINGENNKIIIVEEDGSKHELGKYETIPALKISISGNNNTCVLFKPFCDFSGSHLDIGNDNTYVEIGPLCTIQNVHMRLRFGTSQKLKIGARTIIYGGAIVLDEDSCCYIGSDCLMAGNFSIWGSDGHSIIDKETGHLLNRVQKPVIIEDHCWFGLSCTCLKQTHISKNSIIGAHSVVSGDINEENVVICGIPGKIVKHGCDWSGISPLYYQPPPKE